TVELASGADGAGEPIAAIGAAAFGARPDHRMSSAAHGVGRAAVHRIGGAVCGEAAKFSAGQPDLAERRIHFISRGTAQDDGRTEANPDAGNAELGRVLLLGA